MSADFASQERSLFCLQENVRFVLVSPNYLGNIGSVARAMKNFGFTDLAFVEPPVNYKDAEARMMAVGAFNLLKQARIYDTMVDAVADSSLVYGTTSGRQRCQNLLSVQEAAVEAADASHSNRISFVFGGEKNGLATEDLARCHRLVQIPASPTFPALNLAQSAVIVAYELTRGNEFGKVLRNTGPKYTRRERPAVFEEDQFFMLVEQLLVEIDFLRRYNRQVVLDDLRRLYQRVSPTKRELDLARGLLHKLSQAIGVLRDQSRE